MAEAEAAATSAPPGPPTEEAAGNFNASFVGAENSFRIFGTHGFYSFSEITAVMCGVRICVAAYSNLHKWNT